MASANPLIDLVFSKLALVYGRDFFGRWEGLDMAEVKADWIRELGKWMQHPQAIRHALEHLPAGKPPDAIAFRALCASRPDPSPPALPAPKADPKRVAEIVGRLRKIQRETHPREWAKRLADRAAAGETLTPAQQAAWRDALRTGDAIDTSAAISGFRPIPADCLPPAMKDLVR